MCPAIDTFIVIIDKCYTLLSPVNSRPDVSILKLITYFLIILSFINIILLLKIPLTVFDLR